MPINFIHNISISARFRFLWLATILAVVKGESPLCNQVDRACSVAAASEALCLSLAERGCMAAIESLATQADRSIRNLCLNVCKKIMMQVYKLKYGTWVLCSTDSARNLRSLKLMLLLLWYHAWQHSIPIHRNIVLICAYPLYMRLHLGSLCTHLCIFWANPL